MELLLPKRNFATGSFSLMPSCTEAQTGEVKLKESFWINMRFFSQRRLRSGSRALGGWQRTLTQSPIQLPLHVPGSPLRTWASLKLAERTQRQKQKEGQETLENVRLLGNLHLCGLCWWSVCPQFHMLRVEPELVRFHPVSDMQPSWGSLARLWRCL